MLFAMHNYTVLTILPVAIVLVAFTIPVSVVAQQSSSLSPQSHSLNTIFKQVENSVIQVTSKIPANNTINSQTQNATALGSGFVYDKQGHVITNAHVVGGSKTVDVTFVDGNRYTAKVIGTDDDSDIAVIQITDNNTTKSLKPLTIAISSTMITRVVPALIEKGYYVHPYVGLTSTTLTSDLAETINATLPINFKGVYVDQIKKNSPADKAGIHGSTIDQYSIKHGGDIITAVDGQTITKNEDLISYIDDHKSVGDSVVFTIYRNGHILNLKTILAARPSTSLYPSPLPTQLPP